MKRIILAAATLIVTGITLAGPVHAAGWQNRGDDDWRRNDHHMQDDSRGGNRDDGDRDGRRYSDRRDHDGDRWRHDDNRRNDWRRDRWRHDGWRHHGWRHDGWRPGYGPRIVIRPGYAPDDCFIKKVRVYDAWGNLRIKRIPICR